MKQEIDLISEFKAKNEYLSSEFEKIDCDEFYSYLFGKEPFEYETDYSKNKPNGIYLGFNYKGGKKSVERRLFFNDTKLSSVVDKYEQLFTSAANYYGLANTKESARYLYALVFDIDSVKSGNIRSYHKQFDKMDITPTPTFIVNSGTGLHLYFVFENPINLSFRNIDLLTELKNRLTPLLWNNNLSNSSKVQYQGITQSFRIVGSKTKLTDDCRVSAFKVGGKTTVEKLNSYLIKKEFNLDESIDLENFHIAKHTKAEAKELYPEWYERIIENGGDKKHWVCNEKLYHWWFNRIKGNEVKVGYRYKSLLALMSYARKCNIDFDTVKSDAYSLLGAYSEMDESQENRFTEYDIKCALQGYFDEKVLNYSIDFISRQTNIPILKNKRNGQTQSNHLEIARAIKSIKKKQGNMKAEGRPEKKDIVFDYLKENPNAKKSEIIAKTGLSKPTVYKWVKEYYSFFKAST